MGRQRVRQCGSAAGLLGQNLRWAEAAGGGEAMDGQHALLESAAVEGSGGGGGGTAGAGEGERGGGTPSAMRGRFLAHARNRRPRYLDHKDRPILTPLHTTATQ